MRTFEDFPVGTRLELAPYPVTRAEVIAFASEFDPQPFHLDDKAAEDSLLGGLSASGWHTCAMMMRMTFDGFLHDCASQGSPGVEHIKWLRPVRPGDTLHGTATVVEARLSHSRPHLGLLTLETQVLGGDGAPVLDMRYAAMMLTRAGAAR